MFRRTDVRVTLILLLCLGHVARCNVFDDIGNAVSGAASTVGNAVSGAASTVGNAVTGAADTAGNFVRNVTSEVPGALNTASNAVEDAARTVRTFFTGGETTPLVPSTPYGPVTTKTVIALSWAVLTNTSDFAGAQTRVLNLGHDARLVIRHPGLNQVVLSFQVSGRGMCGCLMHKTL